MSEFAYHRMIVGYHGCDRATVEAVILGGAKLRPSKNVWDWLGHGIYFWEHGPYRAFEFALDQQKRGIVKTPAVLGAYIHLGNCFDLTDRLAMEALAQYFPIWKEAQPEGEPLPENKPAHPKDADFLRRNLDCAVLNAFFRATDSLSKEDAGVYYQTVRGTFAEGEPVFPGAGFRRKTHIQISVRDARCILGYFVPAIHETEPEP